MIESVASECTVPLVTDGEGYLDCVVDESVSQGTTCTVSCGSGFEYSAGSILCQTSGDFNDQTPTCTGIAHTNSFLK